MGDEMKIKMKMNQAGLAKLQAEIAAKINEVDAGIRSGYVQGDPAVIYSVAASRFVNIGIHLTKDQLEEYAAAVSTGSPFEFRLA